MQAIGLISAIKRKKKDTMKVLIYVPHMLQSSWYSEFTKIWDSAIIVQVPNAGTKRVSLLANSFLSSQKEHSLKQLFLFQKL